MSFDVLDVHHACCDCLDHIWGMFKSASPLSRHPLPSISDFNTWLDNRGVVRHEGIEIKYDESGSGWGIRATQDLARGAILCGTPRDSILSARTASFRPPLTGDLTDSSSYVLQLATCLLHELRLGKTSDWYGWLQALPRETIEIPTFWADPEIGGEDGQRGLTWLTGTDVSSTLARKHADGLSLENLREYHASLDIPPTDEHPDSPSFASFLYAYSLVSSRGFVIDAYHSIGLIPFCDMFNHSSMSPHTSLSTDAGVCEMCGSLPRCPHDEEGSDRLANLSTSYLDQLDREGMINMVDMRVQRPVKCGEEIMSCYDDEKRNADLFVEYGFVNDEPNTSVRWLHRDILAPETVRLFGSIAAWLDPDEDPSDDENDQSRITKPSRLSSSAEPNGLIGLISESDSEPLQIRPTGEISQNLFVALYLQQGSLPDPNTLGPDLMGPMTKIMESQIGEVRNLSQRAMSTIDALIELIQRRIQGLHRSESTVAELQSELEVMPNDARLERLGLRAMLQERMLLETCLQRWQDFGRDAS